MGKIYCLEVKCSMFKERGQSPAQHKALGKFRSLPGLRDSTFVVSICIDQNHYRNTALGKARIWLTLWPILGLNLLMLEAAWLI